MEKGGKVLTDYGDVSVSTLLLSVSRNPIPTFSACVGWGCFLGSMRWQPPRNMSVSIARAWGLLAEELSWVFSLPQRMLTFAPPWRKVESHHRAHTSAKDSQILTKGLFSQNWNLTKPMDDSPTNTPLINQPIKAYTLEHLPYQYSTNPLPALNHARTRFGELEPHGAGTGKATGGSS